MTETNELRKQRHSQLWAMDMFEKRVRRLRFMLLTALLYASIATAVAAWALVR